MATEAAQSGNSIFEERTQKLWVAGRASEDRGEWVVEVKVHCEGCYDDKDETSEVQAARILDQPTQRRLSGCLAGEGSRNDFRRSVLRTRPTARVLAW